MMNATDGTGRGVTRHDKLFLKGFNLPQPTAPEQDPVPEERQEPAADQAEQGQEAQQHQTGAATSETRRENLLQRKKALETELNGINMELLQMEGRERDARRQQHSGSGGEG